MFAGLLCPCVKSCTWGKVVVDQYIAKVNKHKTKCVVLAINS